MEGPDAELVRRVLDVAGQQLAGSSTSDISTRAVCVAAGITQPVLYRLFGSKQGLLDQVVDDGFDRYLQRKRDQAESDDPVADLRVGWDDHMEFALSNPVVYRRMFSEPTASTSTARRRVFELLEARLVRVAAVGRLRLDPRRAAQLVLAANVGLAFTMLGEPHDFDDPDLGERMRRIVFAAVLTDGDGDGAATPSTVGLAAGQLRAQLELEDSDELGEEEQALLRVWLGRLSGARTGPDPRTG